MSHSLTDAEIIQHICNGELDYFEHLTRQYTKHIYHFIKSRLFEKENVEDLVQNTFLSFYKALVRFDKNRPVLPYLYQIAKNELKMYYRSHKNTSSLTETASPTQDEILPDVAITEIPELKTLSHEQQDALRLMSEGYSYQEIADKLNHPINTVRTIIHRARLSISKKHNT
ncbi:MAG: RNA polymerase sigma factor [Patescibacteria group bacterium]|jgi:RNA polymerase sigma-70 factor (ECF subfamily)